jgi:hypothetical protein
VCWASVEENPWFSVPLNIARQFLGDPDPTPARAPGPLAFSDPAYVRDILTTAGFKDIHVDTVETTMKSPDAAEQQAMLYLTGGPAARLVTAKSPNAEVMDALKGALVSELQKYETEGGISLGATVHYVAAGKWRHRIGL